MAAIRPLLATLAASALFAAPAQAAAPDSCPGDPITPTQAITGEFGAELQGSYVMVPFAVPAGTTSVRVKYCHDQPDSGSLRHTLDIGLYDARPFGIGQFRGWGGSSHPDVTVTRQGFSSEQQYEASPKGHVPGRTTRGFLPGEIPAGEWAVELGVAAVIGQADGDADGKVAWRVEVELSSDQAFAADPYMPAPYDSRPAKSRAGWYEGDLHVHAEHSALGDATMREVFDYGFGRRGANLDFISLTDYVTSSAWGEIGRHQRRYRGRLILRSSEVITYRGHTNNHASARVADYRTGPIYERAADGSLALARAARPPSRLFDQVHAGEGVTQVNHPTIFPPVDTASAALCRGCFWSYSEAETNWRKVDAYEVHTAFPGTEEIANPFTLSAITEWERLRGRGFDLTAVAVSDSHDAGDPDGPTETPIGVGRTVVFADELSEAGVKRAIERGRAYVKVFGDDSPDLRLTATAGRREAIIGDTLRGRRAEFEVVVSGAESGNRLVILRDGSEIDTIRLRRGRTTRSFHASRPGDYRLQVQRGDVVLALTNPITLRR